MERTRLRELTRYLVLVRIFLTYVEMERTRLRELTQFNSSGFLTNCSSRNGAYPIK